MLQNGVSHRCACVKLRAKGGGIAPFGEVLTSLKTVSRDVGYRSDSIAISRDMGLLKEQAVKDYCLRRNYFKTFLLELIAVRLIPVICPAGRARTNNYWN